MKALVTGGAGFIGSHTTERLLAAGHEVRVIDDLSTGKEANLAAVAGEIDFREADIREYDAVADACDGIEAVLHLAAVSSVEKSIDDPLYVNAVNNTGTLNIFEAARHAGVRRIVLASSAAIYGDHRELPKAESSPVQPLSPYAWQKLSGEFYGKNYGELYGIEFTALRYFNVFGPRQDPGSPYSGVLSIFIDRASRGEPLTIFGDGGQTRDFIHVSDVAEINILAVASAWPLPAAINVATGMETAINAAAGMITELAGSAASMIHREPRKGDIRRSFADNTLLVDALGYAPSTTVRAGLADLVSRSSS